MSPPHPSATRTVRDRAPGTRATGRRVRVAASGTRGSPLCREARVPSLTLVMPQDIGPACRAGAGLAGVPAGFIPIVRCRARPG